MAKEFISISDLVDSERRGQGYDVVVDKVVHNIGTVNIFVKDKRNPVIVTREVYNRIKFYFKNSI